jgi:hypothetical protein
MITVFLIRTRKKLDNVTTIVNVIAISLISISSISIISYYLDSNEYDKIIINNENEFLLEKSKFVYKPNVYFIILDAYSGSEILNEMFEYDNSDFISFLSERGFDTVKNSHSNYASTEESLSSTLNMDYVHERLPICILPPYLE